jgi:hypothetical protein
MSRRLRIVLGLLAVVVTCSMSGCDGAGGIGVGVPMGGSRWEGGGSGPGIIVGGGPVY